MQIVIDIDENIFTRLFDNGTEDYAIVNDDLFTIAKSIRNGTPLETQRPKGKWINIRVIKAFHYDGKPRVRCSCCGNEEEWSSNYCPNCGAEMEVEE